ncbi:hypothetical protein B0H16DRAFT_1698274 [Mycena metata]|uniref:Uncharacterized protein n=1 Tax=Mycena metata TaxID=1033252 RepID=A0AAD7MNZ0_9AGAR|nr:hypothetical protein B0H16DRAFT_1698274 [Mycena metata]
MSSLERTHPGSLRAPVLKLCNRNTNLPFDPPRRTTHPRRLGPRHHPDPSVQFFGAHTAHAARGELASLSAEEQVGLRDAFVELAGVQGGRGWCGRRVCIEQPLRPATRNSLHEEKRERDKFFALNFSLPAAYRPTASHRTACVGVRTRTLPPGARGISRSSNWRVHLVLRSLFLLEAEWNQRDPETDPHSFVSQYSNEHNFRDESGSAGQASSILLPGVVVGESESEKVRELPSVWFETNRLRVAARKHCSAFLSRAAYPSLLLWSILTGLWGKRIPNFDQTSPRFNWPTEWRRSPLAALANQYRRDRRPAPLGDYCAFGASHNPRIDCPRFTGINRHEGQSSANNVYMREKFTGKSFFNPQFSMLVECSTTHILLRLSLSFGVSSAEVIAYRTALLPDVGKKAWCSGFPYTSVADGPEILSQFDYDSLPMAHILSKNSLGSQHQLTAGFLSATSPC